MIIEGCDCPRNCGWNKRLPEISLSGKLADELVSVEGLPHMTPEHLSEYSGLKCIWRCDRNHQWVATVSSRQLGSGCPYCAGKKPILGETDFATLEPEIAQAWDFEKNKTLPSEYTRSSGYRAFWKCGLGHSWSAQINDRVSYRTGCPYCSKRKLLVGFNDLATTHPEIAGQWDYEANGNIRPQGVIAGSKNAAFWKHFHAESNTWHRWASNILDRTKDSAGCPFCANARVLPGFNDLATTHPEVLNFWDYSKNSISPSAILGGTHRKVWWKCGKGHSWYSTVKSRAYSLYGCSECSLPSSSKVERAFYEAFGEYLEGMNTSARDRIIVDGELKSIQVDIFGTYQGAKVAIEYDGSYYHQFLVEKDIAKTQALLDEGWKVIRIREGKLPLLPLDNDNLLQFNFEYSLKPERVEALVKEIISRLI